MFIRLHPSSNSIVINLHVVTTSMLLLLNRPRWWLVSRTERDHCSLETSGGCSGGRRGGRRRGGGGGQGSTTWHCCANITDNASSYIGMIGEWICINERLCPYRSPCPHPPHPPHPLHPPRPPPLNHQEPQDDAQSRTFRSSHLLAAPAARRWCPN